MAEDLLHDRQPLGFVQAAGGLDEYPSQVWGNQGLRKALQPQLESSCQLQTEQLWLETEDVM